MGGGGGVTKPRSWSQIDSLLYLPDWLMMDSEIGVLSKRWPLMPLRPIVPSSVFLRFPIFSSLFTESC